MKILFCAHYLNSIIHKDLQRYETLRSFGHDVVPFSFHAYCRFAPFTKLLFRLGIGAFPRSKLETFNRDLLETVIAVNPDVVWVEKALLLLPETIARAKQARRHTLWVSYQDDNPFGGRLNEVPTWRNFIATIPSYDIHFVKRKSDVDNFKLHGAARVIINPTGFYQEFYHPYDPPRVPSHFQHDTVFIGTALDHRVGSIAYLMNEAKLRMDVYGGLWDYTAVYHRHRDYFHGFAGMAYPLIVSGSKICLGYVSSSNMDEYNGRSVEIPACGGFFLAERTPMHLELYEEATEAVFFSSKEECADKIRFYLRNDTLRRRIARAGYERCLNSDYSLARSMRQAMGEVALARKEMN
jgi:hypothetical protein